MSSTPLRRVALVTLALTLVSACGAESPPRAPDPAPQPGVSVTGEARIGVSGSF